MLINIEGFFNLILSFQVCVTRHAQITILYNMLKVDFLDADKYQSLLRVGFNTLGIKVFYKVTSMIMKTWRTWWWALSSILKVLKVTSLQCLYNISKKKLWIEFILELIKIKTPTNHFLIFEESSQTCPKYPEQEVY